MKKIVVIQDVWLIVSQRDSLKQLWDVVFYDTLPQTQEERLNRTKWADIIYSEETYMHENLSKLSNVFLTFPFSGFLQEVDIEQLKKNNVISAAAKWWNKYAVSERNITALLNLIRKTILIKNSNDKLSRPFLSSIIWVKDLKILVLGVWNIGLITGGMCQWLWAQVDYFRRWDVLVEKIEWKNVIINCLTENHETINIINKDILKDFHGFYISSTRSTIHNNKDILELLKNNQILWYADDLASIPWGDNTNIDYISLIDQTVWYNVFLTPHIAWSTTNAIEYSNDICIQNIASYINWNPINLLY